SRDGGVYAVTFMRLNNNLHTVFFKFMTFSSVGGFVMKKMLFILSTVVMLAGCGEQQKEKKAVVSANVELHNEYVIESGSALNTHGFGQLDTAKIDIDNDGVDELVFLDYGPTSGVTSLLVTVTEDDGMYIVKHQRIFSIDELNIRFVQKNGKTMIEYVENKKGSMQNGKRKIHYYDIVYDNNMMITLSENGESVPTDKEAYGY
ncbi:MAG: membrane lipoprotein lipid attachment site-containing protein, partial [Firmicutes bacterium]|nr:membrane lipoprotein lipid attachment site-containing protein [Bacillota bacterium]